MHSKFCHVLEIISNNSILAVDGTHEARIYDENVSIKFNDISKIEKSDDDFIIDSGSPHYICFKDRNSKFKCFKIRRRNQK